MSKHPATSLPQVPFDADLFVDRDYECRRVVEAICSPGMSAQFFEFQGISGQGKSELLKWVYHQAATEGYCAAYIDLESVYYYRTTIEPLLETIVRHLEQAAGTAAFTPFWDELPAYCERLHTAYLSRLEHPPYPENDELATREHALIRAFHDGMHRVFATRTVVFCLDSTERAYARVLDMFEAQILREYIDNPAFVLLSAGQHPVVWHSVQIKDRIRRVALRPFKRDAVRQQVQRLADKISLTLEESAAVADKIMHLTQGHPYCVYKMMTFLAADRSRPVDTARVDARTGHMLTLLVEQVIEERILEHLSFGDEYPPVKEMLWYLAPLRYIEMSTFRHVLSTFLSDWFRGKNFIIFEQLAGEFQQTAIFTEWRLGNGFNMDALVRHVLVSDMQINDMEFYLTMQEQLGEHYDGLVSQTQDATHIKNIVERIYHYAVFLWGTQPNSVNGNIQEVVHEYLRDYFSIREGRSAETLRDQTGRLYRALKIDEELGNLINIAPILGQIEEHRKGLAM